MNKHIIIGISGASGIILGIKLLEIIKNISDIKTHVIISDNAVRTMCIETDYKMDDIKKLSDVLYDNNDIGASVASGSFKTEGMVIVPCSMKTVAGINCGYSDNLILRAADVCLKERRKLLLVTRETPLSNIHLRNMYELSQSGAIIMPPVMTFYNNPENIEDMVNHICGKILDTFGIDFERYKRWG